MSTRKLAEFVNITKESNEALWVLKRYTAADKYKIKANVNFITTTPVALKNGKMCSL